MPQPWHDHIMSTSQPWHNHATTIVTTIVPTIAITTVCHKPPGRSQVATISSSCHNHRHSHFRDHCHNYASHNHVTTTATTMPQSYIRVTTMPPPYHGHLATVSHSRRNHVTMIIIATLNHVTIIVTPNVATILTTIVTLNQCHRQPPRNYTPVAPLAS